MTQRKSTTLRFGLLPSLVTNSDICSIRSTQSTQLGKLGAQAWLRQTTLQTLQTRMYRYIEVCMSDKAIAYTQQMLSNDEQDGGACRELQGSEDTKFLHSLTHPNTPPPEEADELLDRGKHLC